MSSNEDVCGVCLETVNVKKLPIELDCHHKFCFLCIKGVCDTNPVCPICRNGISSSIITNSTTPLPSESPDIYWLYTARNNGWWRYDPVTSEEIEKNYQEYIQESEKLEESENEEESVSQMLNIDHSEFIISIMGREYRIDFVHMEQSCDGNVRSIKRETNVDTLTIRGIAGLKIVQ